MAELLTPTKPLAVNPLKACQPIGASLAFLGLADCLPLEHGARGCTSFNKLFFMRHFNEPIALQTTAMDQITTVLGADGSIVEALATICERDRPKVIGLISTGLSSMQGSDIPRTVAEFRAKHPEHAGIDVIVAPATDTLGCLESGFALAVEAIIEALAPVGAALRLRHQVNVLASAMLTPGDVEDIKVWIEAYGLTPIMLPDIADSLDGHLTDTGFSTLTYGGTTGDEIGRMGRSAATLVIGRSLDGAADLLRERTGIPDYRFDGAIGLAASDAFSDALGAIANRAMPAKVARKRAQLLDAMVDTQFQLGGARIAIAADADLCASLVAFFVEMGAEVVAAVASAKGQQLASLPLDSVVIGDLEDFEWLARERGADLLVTNSHGADIAKRTGAALLRAGFPIYDSYGAHAESFVGYAGGRRTLFRIADLLAANFQELRPYRSRFRAEPDAARRSSLP
ncbi:MAG: nitrogenase iron-molybdenum cofactor biosynthesis protein NifN [Rhodopseudomonas palustris]|uniref:Nitrogenase iron-molybdenum cofactor biosynthesis protein NifN n=1 Tax=Rhodopseudomonas palustris TaxID=1076 RepID=A0A933S1F1_RHOPL|nr:nitrogenase iron-molybdenum cofactor biosynthesis protein NifN [Rhodopseudomonas palustris]